MFNCFTLNIASSSLVVPIASYSPQHVNVHFNFTLFHFWMFLFCSFIFLFNILLPSSPIASLLYLTTQTASQYLAPLSFSMPAANCSWYSRTDAEHYPACSQRSLHNLDLISRAFRAAILTLLDHQLHFTRARLFQARKKDSYRSLDHAFSALNYPWTLV